MSPAEHERPIEVLGPDRSYPPLGEGVRPRRPDRCVDDPGSFRAEYLVEWPRVLRVPIVQEEPGLFETLVDREVPGLLRHPCRVGMRGHAGQVDSPRRQLDEEQRVQRLQPDRLHREEVGREDAASLGTEERRPGGCRAQKRRFGP